MPEFKFLVYCLKCGSGLCLATKVEGNMVKVAPCEICAQKAYDLGVKAGRKIEMEKREK